MMKWWELLPTRYTSNMLFRPCTRVKKPFAKGTEGQGVEPDWSSRGRWGVTPQPRFALQQWMRVRGRVFLPAGQLRLHL